MKPSPLSRRHILRLAVPVVGGMFVARGAAESIAGNTEPLFSFGLLGDPQYVDAAAAGSRHYRASLGKLRSCVDRLNEEDLEFVVTVGDLIDRDFASFAPVMEIYAGLKAEHRAVLGNHDFSVDDGLKEKVPATIGMKARYLADEREGWRMIRLDGTDMAPYSHAKGSTAHQNAQKNLTALREAGKKPRSYNGGIGAVQMAWLAGQLEDAAAEGQRVLIFNHFPAQPEGNNHNLWNAAELVELLEKHPHVAAYFNGHNHAGNYAEHKGIHYLNVKGMVETPEHTAFSIVRAFPDRLEVHGIDTEPTRSLKG